MEAGVAWLVGHGVEVVFDLAESEPPLAFLAAADDDRAIGLVDALDDDSVDAVWCGRGGTGATRTLSALDALRPGASAIASGRTRPLIGLSDATPLLIARSTAMVPGLAIHGPVITQLPRLDPSSQAALVAWLGDPDVMPTLVSSSSAAAVAGRVEGRLVAGNLAMLAACCGTPEQPQLAGAILLVEDIGEPAWRADRFMAQLARAGALRGLRGLALGTFEDCTPDGGVEAVLVGWARSIGIPCLGGLPVGHGAACWPVALGLASRLDADCGVLVPLESCGDWLARTAATVARR